MSSVLKTIKTEMVRIIDDLTTDNLDESKQTLESYFQMLDVLKTMSQKEQVTNGGIKEESPLREEIKKETSDLEKKTDPSSSENDTVNLEVKTDVEESPETLEHLSSIFNSEPSDIVEGFPLDRKLSGGFLNKGSVSENIYVPETVIRYQNLEHGDIVSVTEKKGSTPYKPLYDFELLEKSTNTSNGRMSFDYGKVIYDKSIKRYIVRENIYGTLLKDGDVPMDYIINEKEEKALSIQMGDVVEIAWYEGNFNKAKLVWKYKTEELTHKETVSEKILSHTKEKKPSEKEQIPQNLAGYTIALIGIEPYWKDYKQLVEERGGTLLTVSSQAHKTSRSASIRKSDLVVVGINHTSHDASIHASTKAKEYKVKFASMSGYGKGTFLQILYKELGVL